MSIILARNAAPAIRLDPTPFHGEGQLQAYIAANPECVPMDEIEEDLRLLVLGREFPTTSGPVDVLAMDSAGVLYLIETKLYANPDKRRVVAQVLDYGAALWAAGVDAVSASLAEFVAKHRSGGLREQVQEKFALSDEETDETLEELRRSIAAGRFRFMVLMDSLHEPLRNLILFLNENSGFQLLAVEVEHYRHEDLQITIPRLFGAQTKGGGLKRASSRWDEPRMTADLDARNLLPEQRELIAWACGFARTLESEGLVSVGFGTGNKPSMLVQGRRLILRISLAKSTVEASITLHMRDWKLTQDEIPKVNAALAELGRAIGEQLSYEPGRLVQIAPSLANAKSKPPIEDALRTLARAL